MTLDIHYWSSSAHQEICKIVKDEILPIVNQVDTRVQNFDIQFLKEAAKFVRDFKSLAKEADLELEIKCLLRAVVSQDIMSIVQTQLSDKVSEQKDTTKGTSVNTKFANQSTSGTKTLSVNSVPNQDHHKTSKEDKFVPNNKVRASVRTNPTTISQPHFITKKDVNYDSNSFSSTGVNITAKTRRPQPKSNKKKDRVPSASKSSCIKNKEVEVEEHHRNLLLSKNKKHMSSECNNVKLAIRNDKSEVVCAMCKQCLITANHHVCVLNYVNDMNSRGKKQKLNVSYTANPKKQKPEVKKPKKVVSKERLASPTPSEPSICLRASKGQSNGDNARTSNPQEPSSKQFPNPTSFLDRNLRGVDLLKGNRTTNLYTINLHEMASASLICLMACATSTKSWLWHQRLSHLNFDTINDLAKNDLVTGLLKFKYHKEHLCPSCEQGKINRASHPPKPVPNSKQRLHHLHMDLCGPMRVESINGKRYVLVIVDDYSCYTWVHFLRSKDEAPEVIKIFLKKNAVLLQALVISNDREDIGKLGAKGDIGFFIGYSANSCAYKVYNQRTKKIIETMNISSGLALPYAPSTITTQKPTKRELDLLFEAMYDDYIGGQPSAAIRTAKHLKLKKALYGLKQAPRACASGDIVGTPMEIKDKLDLDQNGTLVDATKYHSLIGALMYLTSSRPDIVHATCLCTRYQAKPTEKHLKEVKRIFRYLRGTVNMGLWYTNDSSFELIGFSDAD
ncbi:integrase, catalytic region, zinc finger, CCHC-type containing protein [Tanacetum coccineum]